MTSSKSARKSAFSLVELAIVLIIIGLLVAAIAVGQKLIENARTRSVISEINRIDVAIASFHLTYDNLPGDLNNATAYWSTSTNGDGDGDIEISNGSSVNESNFVFEQLSDAALITGGYSSGAASVSTRMSSRVKNSLYEVYQDDDYDLDDDATIDDIDTSFTENVIVLEGNGGNTAGASNYGVLIPRMAYNIDDKMDDGVPNKGKFRAMGATSADSDSCYTVTSGTGSFVTLAITFINNGQSISS
jgi:prepilin-type N-terminal cleavage/methylation domain-containing protein